ALLVQLTARSVELALRTARLGLTQARLRRRRGMIVLLAAGQPLGQTAQKAERTTVLMLLLRRLHGTLHLALHLRREVGHLRHALLGRSLLNNGGLLRGDGGRTQNLRLRLLDLRLCLHLRLSRTGGSLLRQRTEERALRLEDRRGRLRLR